MSMTIRVQTDVFDPGVEIQLLGTVSQQVGAVTSFTGLVRDINEQAGVSGLYLEHYPGMTEKQIALIIDEAAERWQVLAATVIHRVGALVPADPIVFVGVASQHRGDAFHACEYIIDFLKTRATFWKKEQTQAGERWLTTRDSDVATANEWESGPR
ncbi:MAG: molybdopterin synthase catalytic subunit [Candidatus Azotimanducaceae bacterium]|jgi:molybdopterin synthase catalytic subunit